MNPSLIEILATVFFSMAVIHTFLSSRFQHIAHKFPEGSVGENFFHMLGEIEVVFGIWAAVFLSLMAVIAGSHAAITYAEGLNFTEPMFVFAVMAVAATRPVISTAKSTIFRLAGTLPVNREIAIYATCLTIGPILGSFITEPAAMTVIALILRERYFVAKVSQRFKYVTIAVLFVNVSIGGVLTSFAAPPVLMVAGTWGWTNSFMLETFGWKAVLAVLLNGIIAVTILKREILSINLGKQVQEAQSPWWLTMVHLFVLGFIVAAAHHPVIFMGIFLLFLGLATITKEHQSDLLVKQSLLVAFFLGGLVILGGLQRWWLEPVLSGMSDTVLFLGTAGLTALTDNAAITYLGSQIPDLSENFKYALVSGAVAGGGLTVIANAPNPAGFAILQDSFGEDGINPLKLLSAALFPTVVALSCFWLFWP